MMHRRECFPKEEHLLKSKDFACVYKKGASFKQDGLVLYRLPNKLPNTRLGFSISSRNIKLATRRNKTRRVLRDIYRRGKKNLMPGFDIILVVKKDLAKAFSYKELENIFLKLARSARLTE